MRGDVVRRRRRAGRPGALHVQVVDVVGDSVVAKHGRELLLEVGSQNLDQGWTCRTHKVSQSRNPNFSCSSVTYTILALAPLLRQPIASVSNHGGLIFLGFF